jgi:hypothetical protein
MTTSPVDITAMVRNTGNLQQNNVTLTVNIFRELPNGTFSVTPELSTTATTNIATGESSNVSFGLADGVAPDFAPMTYGALRGQGYVIPSQFVSMEANVTPKYTIQVLIGADQNNTNNTMSKIVRFYIRKSNDNRIVLSTENSMTNLDVNATKDQIAGRLNADSLKGALARLGWKIDITNKVYDIDLFDRLGWEQKAVDYTMYRTIFYSDGDDKPYSRYMRQDILNFLNLGNDMEKKNFILNSQEALRQHTNNGTYTDPYFTGNILRAINTTPSNPLGTGGNDNGNSMLGVALFRNITQYIASTKWQIGALVDNYPQTGLMDVSAVGDGLAQPVAYYTNHSGDAMDSVAGVATTTLNRNVVYAAVDWRHWKDALNFIRASIDFILKNGGSVIPVEILSFDANLLNNQVQLNWQTASEYNSDRFEIERAVKTNAGTSNFSKIAEEKASGKSNVVKSYGPVLDKAITIGNTYIYRLKMVDVDGSFSYSQEQEVTVGGDNSLSLGTPVPNPAVNEATMQYSIEASGNVNFDLYDLNGKFVKNLFNGTVNSGNNTLTVNTSDITTGTYNVMMRVNDQTLVMKLQVVK